MNETILNKNCIMIVDDDFINRELLKNIFSSQFTFEEAENGKDGLEKIEKFKDKLCAIILDVEMPELTGVEILEIISQKGITETIPTFLITAHDDDELVETAYRFGVMDVVSKPVMAVVVERRVKSVIELFGAREQLNETIKGQQSKLFENARKIDELQRGTLEALATAIEFRDMESGQHVSRIYGMTKYILTHTSFGEGLSAETIENIARGSIMHDIGKIAISDVILNKPGRLTEEEFEIMKHHTTKGAKLLEQISAIQTHESYIIACDIARHHHERWDGKGYPDGLVGDEISVAAQVVSIADVYDALVSERVYKAPYMPEKAVSMIKNGECGSFNPKLLEAFAEAEPVIRKWYTEECGDETLKKLTEDTNNVSKAYNEALSAAEKTDSDSVMDVMLLMTAVQTAFDTISAVNLTKNTFHLIGDDKIGIHHPDRKGSYDDIINVACEHIPVSHRKEFRDKFSRESLINAFHSGKRAVRMEYPQQTDDGITRMLLTKALLVQDSRTGDIIQTTLMRYIDDEYEKREKARKVLSDTQNIAKQAGKAKAEALSKVRKDVSTSLDGIADIAADMQNALNDKEKLTECIEKIKTSVSKILDTVNDDSNY